MGLLVTSKIKVSCLNVKLKTNWRIVKDMKLCFMQYHIFLIWSTHLVLFGMILINIEPITRYMMLM
jgi:hypothetical protein